MQRSEIFDVVREVFESELQIDGERIRPDSRFGPDLGVDSLEVMTAVMAMEERFRVEIDPAELEGVETVGEAVNILRQKLEAKLEATRTPAR